METLYALAAYQGHDLMCRQFDSQEWQHRAAASAARPPWRVRFTQRVRWLKLLAGQSSAAAAAPETC